MSGATLLVSNSAAGSTTGQQVTRVAEVLRAGGDLVHARPTGPGELRSILRAFDGDRVVVAGGDGSLHLVVTLLDELGRLPATAVGLVPMGTGNDFAAGMGVPEDPVDAARAYLDGRPRRLDLLETDDGEVVVNAAHAGLGAVASDRAQAVKPIAGPLAYPLAALASGAAQEEYALEVTVDGAVVHDGPTLLVLAANGPCLGGGTRLCVGADPADGLLDVLVIGELSTGARAGLAMDIQRGTHVERDDVHAYQGTRLRIRGEAVDHSRDGELRHDLTDATYTMRSAAWDLLLR